MKNIYKIIGLIILITGIYFFLIRDTTEKRISFSGENIELCNIGVGKDNIVNTGENRIIFSEFFSSNFDIDVIMRNNKAELEKHGVVDIISVEIFKKEGFDSIYYINFTSNIEFAGSLSTIEGKMYIFIENGFVYMFSYTDGVDTCDSKKALDEIYQTFRLY